jgi:muconolactone D-isomerase
MRFVLEMQVRLPGDWPEEKRRAMVRTEQEAALAHMRDGHLRRVMRVPGQWGNISIWETESVEQLHEIISGMPAYPWMTVKVTPVLEPEVERMYAERYGPKPPL